MKQFIQRTLKDIKKYAGYVRYAGMATLRAEVANSYLNWLWWIIEPICFMLIYTLIFGYVFGAKEPYFPIFVFIGISVWDFFNRTVTESVKVVKNNKSIIARVYIPKYMLVLIKLFINAFKMAISFAIVVGMMVVMRVPVSWNVLWFPLIVLILFLLTFGVCTIILHFGVYVEDLSNVIKIFLKLMFYMTGVFYNVEKRVGKALGETLAHILGKCNPVACLLTNIRNVLIYQKSPDLEWLLVWLMIGILLSLIGIRLIYKNENSYVKVI